MQICRARRNFLTELCKRTKETNIKSKVKADVDHVNHYFLKKRLRTCYDQNDQYSKKS